MVCDVSSLAKNFRSKMWGCRSKCDSSPSASQRPGSSTSLETSEFVSLSSAPSEVGSSLLAFSLSGPSSFCKSSSDAQLLGPLGWGAHFPALGILTSHSRWGSCCHLALTLVHFSALICHRAVPSSASFLTFLLCSCHFLLASNFQPLRLPSHFSCRCWGVMPGAIPAPKNKHSTES